LKNPGYAFGTGQRNLAILLVPSPDKGGGTVIRDLDTDQIKRQKNTHLNRKKKIGKEKKRKIKVMK